MPGCCKVLRWANLLASAVHLYGCSNSMPLADSYSLLHPFYIVSPGMIELGQLRAAVTRRRGRLADPVSDDDIIRAIKKLKVLGSGIDVISIGPRTYIRSAPGELNMDKNRVMELAQAKGYISAGELAARAGWSHQRCNQVLEELLKEGLAMVDDGAPDGVRLYWFLALMLQHQQQ
eukprot:GHRR01027320.1.p1 GENE.GHRR01027320.1~~GHRR01027320.1.p1  ORF type:complete len:176 (+),score=49.09 GHRR01027320.1:395-922(+)